MAKKRIELTWIEPGTGKQRHSVSIKADLDTDKNELEIVKMDCVPSGVKCLALVPRECIGLRR